MHATAAVPHYLRFARALTFAAGLAGAATGCASSVGPVDGARPDVVADRIDPTDRVTPPDSSVPDVTVMPDVTSPPDATGPDAVADANPCPATRPAEGSPCAPIGVFCSYQPPCTGDLRCFEDMPGSGAGVWRTACAIGPLPPPETSATV